MVGAALAGIGLVGVATMFAATETAVAAIRRARVQQLVDEGSRPAIRLQRLLENTTGFVATSHLISTAAIVVTNTLFVGVYGPPLAVALGNRAAAYAALAAMALTLGMVVIHQMGHALGSRHAEAVGLSMAGAAHWAVVLLYPFVLALQALGRLIYRQPGKARDTSGGITEAGIILQVDVAEEEGVLEEDEGEMIRSIFEFGDTVAREIMVPRIDMVAASATESVGDVVDRCILAGHSRVPIYQESVDRVVGIFYVKDALRFILDGRLDVKVTEVMRPAYFVPETKKVDELLHEMQSRRVHVAIVVDEYGGTAGLVTIEDILEEIVGEIQDEFDAEEAMMQRISDHEVVVDAIMTLDDVNDVLSIQLEAEDVDTLGGYIYAKLGRVPEQGDQLEVDGVKLIIADVEGNRINKVRIIKSQAPPPADGSRPAPAVPAPPS